MSLEEAVARLFHDEYEALAVKHGWKTQESCRAKSFDELPQANRELMIETCQRVFSRLPELPGVRVVEAREDCWMSNLGPVSTGCLICVSSPGDYLIIRPVEKKE